MSRLIAGLLRTEADIRRRAAADIPRQAVADTLDLAAEVTRLRVAVGIQRQAAVDILDRAAEATQLRVAAATLRRATEVVATAVVVAHAVAEGADPTEAVRPTATAAADITGDS